jgi:putative endonuclease
VVARELQRRGWRIVARNARPASLRGELDIVALDGAELVIVEVKAGRAGAALGPVSPVEMVGPRKRARLRALASAWAREHRAELPRTKGLRIDVVGLRIDAAGRVAEWRHVRAAC